MKYHSALHLSFYITTAALCSYHFSFTSIPYFLYFSQWIFVPNHTCHGFTACSCEAIIKASVVLFNQPPLSHPYQSSLALPIVFLINCPCNCFCVNCVFFSFFFLFCTHLVFIYLHCLALYVQQLTISLCCFLHNFFTSKLLSPQYLVLHSFLFSCQSPLVKILTNLRTLQNTSPLILSRC